MTTSPDLTATSSLVLVTTCLFPYRGASVPHPGGWPVCFLVHLKAAGVSIDDESGDWTPSAAALGAPATRPARRPGRTTYVLLASLPAATSAATLACCLAMSSILRRQARSSPLQGSQNPDKQFSGIEPLLTLSLRSLGQKPIFLQPPSPRPGAAVICPASSRAGVAVIGPPLTQARSRGYMSPVAQARGRSYMSPLVQARGPGHRSPLTQARGPDHLSPHQGQRPHSSVPPRPGQGPRSSVPLAQVRS